MSQSRMVHPLISLLVRILEKIEILYEKGLYIQGWDVILNTMDLLRPRDYDKQLAEELRNAIDEVLDRKGITPQQSLSRKRRKQDELMRGRAEEYKRRFVEILWDGNYMVNEGYGMYYSAEQRPSR